MTLTSLAPPVADPSPALPSTERLVTPDILYLNQGSTYRLANAFAGTSNPTVVWSQMIDNAPTAMMYYRELEAKDDDIGAAVAESKLSVMKRDWQITPGDESAQAQQAADFIRSQIEGVPNWQTAFNALLDAPFYGYVVSELMFDTSMGQASLKGIEDCPQELFCFAPFGYPQIGQLRLKDMYGSSDGALVPEQKFIIYSSRSRNGNRMGSPILREIFWASWFKRNVQRFWMRAGEKGPGTAVVTHKDNATADEKNKALAAAEALINDVALAVPESFAVMQELLKGTRPIDPAVYEKLYAVLEAKIYRRIVGGTLTSHGSDGGKGTQALGKVHQETAEATSIERCKELAGAINWQLIPNLTLWNFGPDCPKPKFSFQTEDEADQGELVTVTDTLQGMGLEIPRQWAYGTFGIPAPRDGEEVLQRPVAPVQSVATPAGPPFKPDFSETQQRQVDADKAELDTLFAGLRKDVLAATAKQIGIIADNVEQSGAGRVE